MKGILRIISVLALAAMVLTALSACGGKADYAIKVGDLTVSEGDYARQAATLASYIEEMEAGDLEDPEVFETYVQDYLIDIKLFARQFEVLNLSFTAEEEEEISTYLSEVIESYGSMSEFNTALAEAGYTYDEYMEEIYDYERKAKVLDFYFGPEGEEPVEVQDLKDYYQLHNALIKYVAISNSDSETGELLSETELKKAKEKIEEAYSEATKASKTDRFPEVIEIYSEDTSTRDTGIVITDTQVATSELAELVMEMEIGEVMKAEMDDGFMVIKRYDATADDHFTADVQQSVLEEVRAEEIEELLTQWREETKIKINKRVTKKYRNEA